VEILTALTGAATAEVVAAADPRTSPLTAVVLVLVIALLAAREVSRSGTGPTSARWRSVTDAALVPLLGVFAFDVLRLALDILA
jgi:hypothetical protein